MEQEKKRGEGMGMRWDDDGCSCCILNVYFLGLFCVKFLLNLYFKVFIGVYFLQLTGQAIP